MVSEQGICSHRQSPGANASDYGSLTRSRRQRSASCVSAGRPASRCEPWPGPSTSPRPGSIATSTATMPCWSLLASDALGDLADQIEAAQAGVAQDTHATRWFVGCVAMRHWSLEHPAEYGLIFDTETTRGRPRIAAQSGNRAFLAFRSACAGALEDREIDPDRPCSESCTARPADDLPAAADLLAATGMACLVGHLSIEIGGRIGSPLTTEERYPIFVRAVMRLLGFTLRPVKRRPSRGGREVVTSDTSGAYSGPLHVCLDTHQ